MKIEIFEHEQGKTPKKSVHVDERLLLARTKKRNTGIEVKRNEQNLWRHGLAELFDKNELAPIEQKLTRNQIIDTLIKRYPHLKLLKRHFKVTHKYTISAERRKYNYGSIYSAQPKTILTSHEYNWEGYPIVAGFGNQFYKDYIYWEEAFSRVCDVKVADPRFFEYEQIVEMRNRQIRGEDEWLEWVVPTDKELQDVSRKLEIDIPNLFNSILFAPGFTREETPKDFVPFKDYLDKKKKAHDRSAKPYPISY